MGQAKARGTLEKRRTAALEREDAEETSRILAGMQKRLADQRYLASLAPEARQLELDRRRVKALRAAELAALMALVMQPLGRE